jgi:hypothetical protein
VSALCPGLDEDTAIGLVAQVGSNEGLPAVMQVYWKIQSSLEQAPVRELAIKLFQSLKQVAGDQQPVAAAESFAPPSSATRPRASQSSKQRTRQGEQPSKHTVESAVKKKLTVYQKSDTNSNPASDTHFPRGNRRYRLASNGSLRKIVRSSTRPPTETVLHNRVRSGDWVCTCGDYLFSWRTSCRTCGRVQNSAHMMIKSV